MSKAPDNVVVDELERRLTNWAQEYGGGRYEHVGWHSRSVLAALIEHKGEIPNSRGYIPIPTQTQADEVECVVRRMAPAGLYRAECVLRCEYFMYHSAEESKLCSLRAIGMPLGRSAYYSELARAKAFVAGALTHVA